MVEQAEEQVAADAIVDWLVDQSLLATPLQQIVAGCCARLNAAGLSILRGNCSTTTLHPEFEAVSATWQRHTGTAEAGHAHGSSEEEQWQRSPLRPLAEGTVRQARHRLEGEILREYPILHEFRQLGGTDYIALATPWGRGGRLQMPVKTGMLSSWVTDRPGGFRDSDIAALQRIQRALAAAVRTSLNMVIAETVLSTYMGSDAGRRVLSGEIRRGDVTVINAAILLADLQGFTALSDRMARDDLVPMLNDYLGAMAGPVEAGGGQILKFLGDGLLATFPLDGDAPAVCRAAVAASGNALAAVETLNRERADAGAPTMALDIAMHVGDVLYGNVGAEHRLEFTVVGPAVNVTSRMEALCAELDCRLVISRRFVEVAAAPGAYRSLGQHRLRGVRDPQEVFTLRD